MVRYLLILTVLSLAVACSNDETAKNGLSEAESLPSITPVEPGFPPLEYGQLTLGLQSPDGQRTETFRVYDAANRAALTHGLMGVTDLPPDAGMLFRFSAPQDGAFRMTDTPIPLSIAFADKAGVITAIQDMQACAADPCPRYRPDAPFTYALEANRGAFGSAGVTEGWRMNIPSDLPPPPQ